MQGEIKMDSNLLSGLIDPVANQEAATKKYHDDNLPAGGYNEGAKVHRNAVLNVASTVWTTVTFQVELWDGDNIWSAAPNPSRLTCRTAGKYLVYLGGKWEAHATGFRTFRIFSGGVTSRAYFMQAPFITENYYFGGAVVLELAVNEYIELSVYQASGVPLDFGGTLEHQSYFGMQRIAL